MRTGNKTNRQLSSRRILKKSKKTVQVLLNIFTYYFTLCASFIQSKSISISLENIYQKSNKIIITFTWFILAMASELPDALEKLALKAERSENDQGTSLSKYFGQPDNTDDIFDTIVKPSRPGEEEPKVNFFKSPASTPVKEDSRQNIPPTVAFKKSEQESEPKIFSYFSQPAVASSDSNKNADATEFFDQISQLASKSHEPIEISSSGFNTTPQPAPINSNLPKSQSIAKNEITNVSTAPGPLTLSSVPSTAMANVASSSTIMPLFTPQLATTNLVANEPSQFLETWSKAQERASNWWIPNETTRRWLQSTGSSVAESFQPSYPGLLGSAELVHTFKFIS